MLCPYCNKELEYDDFFGRLFSHQDGRVLGYIYRCINEKCDSEIFNHFFYYYIGEESDLKEGYPC